ncbi:FliM/FliN family flagellar motor switch protein [Pseudomonas baetica]|uniref:FliM/FliN family flagellar motor switch protein n=1 Tax=Pseudomonas baetica TaxID=674054 RepID=UPI002405A941|nr:FliM/FliN family flagellar motor switch protein [Pseudomonas baetica]MDF9777801.1 type III secretion protein Q [Pseudomonas baetica]
MSALQLRRINARAHAAAQAIRRWQSADVDAGSGHPPGQSGYLCFRASGEGGEWRGLIDARDWLHRSLPGLRSLLSVECSLMNIAELFRAVPQPLLLEVDDLHYRQISDVDGVLPGQLPPQELPWLDTPRGRLWLTRLPPARAASRPLDADSWLSDLPLRLELMLGSSHLRHGIRLKAGDVLRIIQRSQRCYLGHQCLGAFTFTEQGIHMLSTATDAQSTADSDPDFDLGALPVRLEFLLATREIDLATLSRIIAGQLIPLADNAVRHIEVRANGKPVARGELVQLQEQLAVELLEVYRNGSPDGMPQ